MCNPIFKRYLDSIIKSAKSPDTMQKIRLAIHYYKRGMITDFEAHSYIHELFQNERRKTNAQDN